MARTIQDQNLLLWEAYATAGDFGFPEHARLVFHCLTDPGRRARYLERDGDTSDVENEVATLSDRELLELLQATEELS
jgi:hypothetical protein